MAKDPRFDPEFQKNKQQTRESTNQIQGKEIGNNTILSEHLANGAVTPGKISTDWPVFAGTFASYGVNTNYFPALVSTVNVGFTVDAGASSLTIQQAGYYYVHAQQLVNTGGTVVYFNIRKDNNTIVHAYSNNDDTYDLVANAIIQCSVGSVISFYYSGTTTYSWGGAHSSVSCHFIRP